MFCTKIASRLTRTYTDRHGLKDICAELIGVEPFKGPAIVGLGGRPADARAARICRLRRALSARDCATCCRRGWRATAALSEAEACFRFLPTRAKLDLMGWDEEDIFAHS